MTALLKLIPLAISPLAGSGFWGGGKKRLTSLALLLLSPVCQGITPDMVFSTFQSPAQLCLNDGEAAFACRQIASSHPERILAIALGDVNGDSHTDAVFNVFEESSATDPELSPQVCLGDGAGNLDCHDIGMSANGGRDVALADLDRDGFLDVVFANTDGNTVCYGHGNVVFTCAEIQNSGTTTQSVAIGDLNNDGALDLIFANFDFAGSTSNRRCLAVGARDFSCDSAGLGSHLSQTVALADVDNDTFEDAVFGNSQAANQVCLNDGSGNFRCRDIAGGSKTTTDIAVEDFNGDALSDLVFANTDTNALCFGDGTGNFGCADFDAGSNGSTSVAVGDMDNDNHLDIVTAGPRSRICLGDGSGGFTCADIGSANAANDVALGQLGEVTASPPPVAIPTLTPAALAMLIIGMMIAGFFALRGILPSATS